MAGTIHSYASMDGLWLDTPTQNITAQKGRDFIACAFAWAGGRASIQDDTGIANNGSGNQYSALATLLNTSGGVKRLVPAGTYALGSSGTTLTQPCTLVSLDAGDTIFTRGSESSGVDLFNITAAMRWRGLRWQDGGTPMSFNSLTTGLESIEVDYCEFYNIRAPLRWSLTSGVPVSALIERFRFNDNFVSASIDEGVDTNRRGLYFDGNGVSHGLVTRNYISNVARFAILLSGRRTSQEDNTNSRNIIALNICRDIYPLTTLNSNICYTSGKLHITALNQFGPFLYNGTAGTTDGEGYYSKTWIDLVALNIFLNASTAGQGAVAFKGNLRSGSGDGGPNGFLGLLLGCAIVVDNAGIYGAANQYTTPDGVWVQKEGVQAVACIFDNIEGIALAYQQSFDYRGAGFIANSITEQYGSALNLRGPHSNTRFSCNFVEKSRDGSFVALRPDGGGNTLRNISLLGNVMSFSKNVTPIENTAGSATFYHVFSTGTLAGVVVAGGVCDAEFEPNGGTNIRGLRFIDAAVTDFVVDLMVFRNFPDPTSIFSRGSGTQSIILGPCITGSGFKNFNRGTVTITAPATSATFDPGLTQNIGFNNVLPHSAVHVAPVGVPGALWGYTVDSATQVTVTMAAPPAVSQTFSWQAWMRELVN